jgi:glycosyltransferase involved in cell wall biosynthesis
VNQPAGGGALDGPSNDLERGTPRPRDSRSTRRGPSRCGVPEALRPELPAEKPVAGTNTGRLVSVVIPVHNGERYLAEAIESVLGQNYRHTEIIVVDDGSADGSAVVCSRFPVRYTYQPHAGAAAARNRGVEAATGSLLGFLDADDLWVPERLSRQMAALEADPTLDMVSGLVRQFHSPDLEAQAKARIGGDRTVLAGHVGTVLIKRTSFLRVGWFSSEWRVGEFIDWFGRAQDVGLNQMTLPDIVLLRRLHGNNMMVRESTATKAYAKILKAALDRRRASP